MDKTEVDITFKGYKCFKCTHQWIPRNKDERPRMCPKCKSVRYDEA